jgi:excinuclease UvrABC nuclease subunit
VLTLDSGLEFDPARDEEFFSALPPLPAVCLIEPQQSSAQPLFIRTQDLRRRLQRLLGPLDSTSQRLNLRNFTKSIRYRVTASAFEQTFAYYRNAKELFPERYQDMLRLRPPAMLKVNLRNAYPRCYATRKISIAPNGEPSGGVYYGPFPSRKAADAFAERALDLFKVRRCQIKIRRDPEFPGCIYSEMKMCLAPCFAGCTKEEYDVEVQSLVTFLETGGASLRETLEVERNQYSEAMDFEKAALLHKKLDKLDDALRGQPELPRRLQDLNAVIFQRSSGDQTIGVYEVRAGRIVEPFQLSFTSLTGDPRSAEQLLRQHLEPDQAIITQSPSPSPTPQSVIPSLPAQAGEAIGGSDIVGRNLSSLSPTSQVDLSEHLWLLARWFYSHPRQGEIFFRANAWPYRRMMRACARLLAPPEAKPSLPRQNKASQQDNLPEPGEEREKNS